MALTTGGAAGGAVGDAVGGAKDTVGGAPGVVTAGDAGDAGDAEVAAPDQELAPAASITR
jgi:hypothetical protein